MDWTWRIDPYVGGGLALAAAAVFAVAAGWWVGSGLWLLRKGAARAFLLLPVALSWGLGLAHKSGPVLLVLLLWLSVEVVAPQIWAKGPGRSSAPDLVAASAAGGGALACLGAHLVGPLPRLPALLFNWLAVLAFSAGLLGTTLVAFILWRRRLQSRVWRAVTAASVVLAFDALYLSPGGLTVLFLCVPLALQLGLAGVAAMRRSWRPGRRCLAAAAVWLAALASLIGFSRLNLSLSESRSTAVIAACRAYERDHSHLPMTLDELVPTYLPRVPRADWTIAGEFRYTGGDEPALAYFAPWPLEVVYSFDTGERQVRRTEPGSAERPPAVDDSTGRLIAQKCADGASPRTTAAGGHPPPGCAAQGPAGGEG